MKKHILLVEDDRICASIEKKIFESLDCDVTLAGSGEAALDLFIQSIANKTPFDAISMDIGLPKKNGIETCAAIRAYEAKNATTPIPIIAVTSNVDADIVNKCLAAGMLDVMSKPFLKQAVIQFLSKCQL
ncbi:MAG: response regulator [Gammaproteobacteria bacterium]|nr:response regulator [Gammaproteobacteria bacterium]